MKRREALSSMAILFGGAIVSTEVLFSSCNSDLKEAAFTEDTIKLLDEIGETIIPYSTSSPGAKAAKIGEFMKVYVMDCYNETDQKTFLEGINKFRNLSKERYGKEFLKLTLLQKQDLLNTLEIEAQEHAHTNRKRKSTAENKDAIQTGKPQQDDKSKAEDGSSHYYSMIRDLTLLGYFTSEPGATKALRYVQTPGSYNGNVLYKKGDKSWAM
ncbi:MAG TPA: gluconate 2-dehydrogenase subunit 3 family protein [Hanamia sp.]|jgi:hypothetical protein